MTTTADRDACDRLARRLAEPEGLRVARMLQQAGLFDRGEGPAPAAATSAADTSTATAGPRAISIWEPRTEGGDRVFRRPPPGPFGDHYAAREVIPARKAAGSRRVCLFGESVAAGYLYAPHLTPAQVLAAYLGAAGNGGAGGWDVVDLARTNETLGSLVVAVEASLQLDPDALVVFAGNNWTLLETPERSPYAPSVRARQRYAGDLRRDGLYGPIERAAREVLGKAGAALAAIDRLATAAGAARAAAVPVVLVVPEVNLADWEDRQPVPWLPGDGVARWYRHLDAARRALAAGRWAEAEDEAAAMVALDDGVCPTPHRLLVRARRGAGDEAGAARAARAEVAAGHYATLGFLAAPRATPMVQELLRRAARHHGFRCADLPAVFAEHTSSPLPGRRLFLDYCHLTVEGMAVAMAAAAAEVLTAVDPEGRAPSWRRLLALGAAPEPSPAADAADAAAKLGAALHSAHRLVAVADGAKAEVLEHWCREALAASPAVAATMRDLVGVRCAPCPAVLTAEERRNQASPAPLTPQHGWHYDYLDLEVIEAIASVLEEREPGGRPPRRRQAPPLHGAASTAVEEEAGKAVRGEIERRLVAAWVARGPDLDLVDPPFFLAEPLERFFPAVMDYEDLTRSALFRAAWPESSFVLIADGETDLAVEIVARLPAQALDAATPRRGTVAVRLDGEPLAEVELAASWRRTALTLPRHRVPAGVHRLTLAWPLDLPTGEAALEAAAERLELGLDADVHPVFGELFSLLVRPVAGRPR